MTFDNTKKGPGSDFQLSRWDDEGGAQPPLRPSEEKSAGRTPTPDMTNAELVQLRVRVIALENVLIALLLNAGEQQLGDVRRMAGNIPPRPGVTPHPLTIQAADHMLQLVDRADHYRGRREPSPLLLW